MPSRPSSARHHRVRPVDGVERGEPDAVTPGGLESPAHLQRQPGLADAAHAGERDDPGQREVLDQRLDVEGPSEQQPGSGRQVAGAHAARPRRPRVALERRILQSVEPHGLDHIAELVDPEIDQRRRRHRARRPTTSRVDELRRIWRPLAASITRAARFTAGPK